MSSVVKRFFLQIYGEPISVAVGVGSAVIASLLGVFNYYARCKIFECCDNKWVKANDAGMLPFTNIYLFMRNVFSVSFSPSFLHIACRETKARWFFGGALLPTQHTSAGRVFDGSLFRGLHEKQAEGDLSP